MADRTQLRVADHNDIADDDPFAELTRIMGFDPRQPVKASTQSNEPQAHSQEDDFDIDLEKELMGEFDIGHVEAAPVAARHEPRLGEAAADDFELSFEDDLQPRGEPQLVDPGHFAEELTDAEPVSANEAGFDLDFDNAVASAFEAPSPQHDDASMEEELAASFGQTFAVDDAQVAHDAHAVAMPVLDAEEHDFAAAAANSLEDELFFEDHEDAGSSAHAVSPTVQASSDDELGNHFADLDFSLDPEAAAAPYQAEPVADVVAPRWDETVHAVANDPHEADLSLEFDDAFAEEFDEPAQIDQPVAPAIASVVAPAVAQAVPMPSAPVAPVAERSLEDELNALLGVMTARTVAKEAPVQQTAPAPRPVSPAPVAAAPVSPKPATPAADLEWELDEQPAPQPAYQAAQSAYVEPTHAAHAHADLDDQLLDELQSQDFADGPARDADFDHDAFDAAFAASINTSQPGGARAPAPASSWQAQRSTPPEPARSWSRSTPVAQQPQASFAHEPQPSFSQPPRPAFTPEPAVAAMAVAATAAAAQTAASSYRLTQETAAPPVPPKASAPRYEEMPEVETVDVPERVVALADDLDIPELHFDEGETTASGYDDLDAEFASLLTEMNTMEMASGPARAASYEDESYSGGFKPRREADRAETVAYAAKPVEMPASAAQFSPAARGFEADELPGSQPLSQADEFAVDELDYDPELDQDMSIPAAEQQAARRPRGRGMFIGGIIGAVVLAGGLGALAMSFGGKGSGEAPVIVKADNQPIKVKPENPGGTVVPNQDNKVYDAVLKGAKPAEQVQDKLVNSSEEPVDVTPKEQPRVVDLAPDANNGDGAPNAAPASTGTATDATAADGTDTAAPQPKSEDRIAQVVQDAEKNPDVVAVAPRKVRTMMVKSDGSLVPREDSAPAALKVAAAEPTDPAPQLVAPAGQDDAAATGTLPPAGKAAKTAKAKAQSSTTPATVPVAPQRPSDQPVDVVGEVKPDQVASIDAASAAGGGSWSMQIASQPTVESAQSTYQDLQRRYGSVLAGHTANIVKAEIAGKGTFYRVRVPAQSRNDAINLCSSYKAAGGNCFVSK